MNSFWRFLSLGSALILMGVVAGILVAKVYLHLFPGPTFSAADPEQTPSNVPDAVAQPAPPVAAPPIPSQGRIEKTVEACQEEWRAMRATGERTTTEKAYVAQCRAGDTAAQTAPTTPAPVPSAGEAQKTVEACQAEWRAMRAAGQRTTTEKAYVAQCHVAASAPSPATTGLRDSPSEPAESVPAPGASPADTARPRRRIIQQ